MSGPKAIEVNITEAERQALTRLMRAKKTPQSLAFRAKIILGLAQGKQVKTLATELGTQRETIRLWRTHWLERVNSSVLERLEDEPRKGAPATFTAEQWCQIMALACEAPEKTGRPITHWTSRELAEEAIARGIVPQISSRHIARFLKRSGFKTASKPLLAKS